MTDTSVAKLIDATSASVAPQSGHVSLRATSPTVEFLASDTSIVTESSVYRSDRCGTENTAPRSADRRDAASDARTLTFMHC
jgi:hypothetical protein